MATQTTNYHLSKPESTDPFGDFRQSYNDNLDIIDANLGGGGGSSSLAGLSDVDISAPADGQVLTYDNVNSKWVNANPSGGGDVVDVEVNGVSVVDGNKVAKIISYKEVTQAQYDALPSSKLTDGIAYFIKDGGGSGGSGSFLLIINAETGETVTATKGGTTLTATEVSTGIYEVEITSSGTWTISDGNNTATVDVGVYTATLSSIPEGSTVTPTDDVSIWLACGGRTENYTTVSEVLADSTCLLALLSDNNANDYLVRSTTWASTITADSSAMTYIGLDNYCANTLLADATWCNAICNSTYFESVLNVKVPTMTSNTTPEGVASAPVSNATAYRAFNGVNATAGSQSFQPITYAPTSVQYQFVSEVTIYKLMIWNQSDGNSGDITKTFKVEVSNGGNTWNDVTGVLTNTDLSLNGKSYYLINASRISGDYCRFTCIANVNTARYPVFASLQFYGRKDI